VGRRWLAQAVDPNPAKCHATLSESIFDLSLPNPAFLEPSNQPLIEHNPLAFWKGLALLMLTGNLLLIYWITT